MNKISPNANASLRKTLIDSIATVALITQKKLSGKTNAQIQDSISEIGQLIERNLEKSAPKFREVYAILRAQAEMGKWKEILKFLEEPSEGPIPSFVVNEMYENTAFFGGLMTSAYDAFQHSQWQKAHSLYFFIASLYPFYLKPYLFLAALEEKIHGAASAIAVYEALLQSFQDPELYFCAAECFWRNGKQEEVVPLLTHARDHLQNLEALLPEEKVLQKNILGLLEALK